MLRYQSGLSFEPSPAELKIYSVFGVEPPTGDPERIIQQLMAFRNERRLHRRKCDLTGKEILSAYPEKTPFPVYKNDVWWGDGWSPYTFARPIDFSRPFFEQFKELQDQVPREGTSVYSSENCDYNGHIRESKNCYMNALIYRCEDTHYSYWMVGDKDVADCLMVNNSSLAYDCMDCDNLFECVLVQECFNCQNCYFSYQLRGCQNCIGCSSLVNAQYCISNKQVTPAEFEAFKSKLVNGTRDGLERGRAIFNDVYKSAVHRCVHTLNCEQVIGDHCANCRKCTMAFDGYDGEDVYHSVSFGPAKDTLLCYSAGWPLCEVVYQSVVTRGSSNIGFSYYSYFSSGLRYCDSLMQSQDCFGCISLRRAKNCILNQAYPVHEYEKLTQKLTALMRETGEWGRFFPPQLSTFGYNITAAQEYYPLTREAALKAGWRWFDEPQAKQQAGEPCPRSLGETPADITTKALACEESGKLYRIAKQELEFYRRMNLPLPHLSPDVRHRRRLDRRAPHQMFRRSSDLSPAEVYSSFGPSRTERICSEEEFQRMIY